MKKEGIGDTPPPHAHTTWWLGVDKAPKAKKEGQDVSALRACVRGSASRPWIWKHAGLGACNRSLSPKGTGVSGCPMSGCQPVWGRNICFRIKRPHRLSSFEVEYCMRRAQGKGGMGDFEKWGLWGHQGVCAGDSAKRPHGSVILSLWVSL